MVEGFSGGDLRGKAGRRPVAFPAQCLSQGTAAGFWLNPEPLSPGTAQIWAQGPAGQAAPDSTFPLMVVPKGRAEQQNKEKEESVSCG